jgi:hypothetical protein
MADRYVERPVAEREVIRERDSGSSATPWLAFLVGGLLIALVIGFFVFGRGGAETPELAIPDKVDVDINTPKLPDAPSINPQ